MATSAPFSRNCPRARRRNHERSCSGFAPLCRESPDQGSPTVLSAMLEELSMKTLNNAIGRWIPLMVGVCAMASGAMAQERRLTIQEAIDLALRANHGLRAASYGVAAEEQKRRIARSDYFPSITNESNLLHITDLQRIEVPPGTFGAGIPASNVFLTQGTKTFESS